MRTVLIEEDKLRILFHLLAEVEYKLENKEPIDEELEQRVSVMVTNLNVFLIEHDIEH